MDPQKLAQLDPKIREQYERVMGTAIPQASAQPAQPLGTTTPPQPQTNFAAPPVMPMKKKGSSIMPVLFAIVGIIFLIIYTLFWTKIFNVKLPFLP